jgi:hypothetical protein
VNKERHRVRATLLHPASLLSLLAASLAVCGPRTALAQSADPPVCVFLDRSYSEGATVCPQTRFMLMCSSEGSKLIWKTVSDRSLAERCLRPTTAAGDLAEPLRQRRLRIARSSPPPAPPPLAPLPAASTSAKCFVFNGKRYCE